MKNVDLGSVDIFRRAARIEPSLDITSNGSPVSGTVTSTAALKTIGVNLTNPPRKLWGQPVELSAGGSSVGTLSAADIRAGQTVDLSAIVTSGETLTATITDGKVALTDSFVFTLPILRPDPVPSIGSLTSNTTHGPTAQDGITLTAEIAGLDGRIATYQWQENGAPIPGATGDTFTPELGVNVANLAELTLAIVVEGQTIVTPAVRVRHAPPIVSGTLSDVSYPAGSGDRNISAADGFAGKDLTYGTSDGVIDASTGEITRNPMDEGVTEIVVTATNSGGTATITFTETVTAVVTTPPQSAVDSLWIGHVSPTTMTATVRNTDSVAETRIIVSTSQDLASAAAYSTTLTPDADNLFARGTVAGLTEATDYHVGAEIDGVLSDYRGKFRTAAASGGFSMCLASCAASGSNHPIFDTIRAQDPDMFVHMGDLHYQDITANDETLFHSAFDTAFLQPRQNALWSSIPTYYMFDDHDAGGGNNSDASSTAMPAAVAAYRARVPCPALATQSGAINYTFDRGPVRFAVLDVRSQRVVGNLLGAAQEAWLIDLIETLPAGMVLGIVSTVPWISESITDTWSDADAQRTRIGTAVTANIRGRAFVMGGDMHALAYDDGSNSVGGMPVVHAAPLDRSNTTKGGPYSTGPITETNNQFGRLDVTPTTDGATIRFRGFSVDSAGAETVQIDRTFALETPITVAFGDRRQSATALEDGSESDTSATVVLDQPATAGNLIVVCGGPDKGFTSPQAPSGFETAISAIGGSGETLLVYYKIAVGGEQSITTTWTGTARWSLSAVEYQGPFSAAPLDVSAHTRTGANVSSVTVGPTEPPTQGKNLILAYGYAESGTQTGETMTLDNGFIRDASVLDTPNGGTPKLVVGSKVITDGSAQQVTATYSGSDAMSAWIGFFAANAVPSSSLSASGTAVSAPPGRQTSSAFISSQPVTVTGVFA